MPRGGTLSVELGILIFLTVYVTHFERLPPILAEVDPIDTTVEYTKRLQT